jgi:hypothetical protein
MASAPDHSVTVLSGHTHSKGDAQMLPNLQVLTGAAAMGSRRCSAWWR